MPPRNKNHILTLPLGMIPTPKEVPTITTGHLEKQKDYYYILDSQRKRSDKKNEGFILDKDRSDLFRAILTRLRADVMCEAHCVMMHPWLLVEMYNTNFYKHRYIGRLWIIQPSFPSRGFVIGRWCSYHNNNRTAIILSIKAMSPSCNQ